MKTCVIMSVYNGEKYIGEQLDSIFSQNYKGELFVYIRDDGSTDNTLEYLRKRSEYSALSLIIKCGDNRGAAGSFLEAIKNAPEADIYAFCDQDDVWETGKIRAFQTAIESEKTLMPVLWISNYNVVDKDLKTVESNRLVEPVTDDLYALFYNNIPGCVMAFNKALLHKMRQLNLVSIRMHDIMALNIALLTGKMIYDSKSYVNYRQHENNAIGYKHKKIKPFNWIKDKIKLFVNKESYSIDEYAEQVLVNFSGYMSEYKKSEYMVIRDYKKNIINKLRLLSKNYTRAKINRTTISIRCKILFGLM